jgi:hypothetical protein
MTASATRAPPAAAPHFTRAPSLRSAIAVNMTQMCGIGPFITIPQFIAAMGGHQAIIGWVLGTGLTMADGVVWAELGAAMPGAGSTCHIAVSENPTSPRRTTRCALTLFELPVVIGIRVGVQVHAAFSK